MAKIYQIATVLYDVLKTVVPKAKVDAEVCFLINVYVHFSFETMLHLTVNILNISYPLLIWLLQTQKYAQDVEEKKEQHEHYNILPLYAVGVKPAIMKLPEVLHKMRSLFWICWVFANNCL